MRAKAVIICGVRDGDWGILDNLYAVLHVFLRVVELVQCVGREGERFGEERVEGLIEVMELGHI